MKKTVIIGGGAAGLMAAAFAKSPTVIEKNTRPARKVMITGKGRCNVTNTCDKEELIKNVPRNGKFLFSAFGFFDNSDTVEYFESLSVPLKTERGKRVFPVSDKAVDIVDALIKGAKQNNAHIISGEVKKIETENGKVTGVLLSDGKFIPADSIILATGGISYPTTGSTGDGYEFAKQLGHTVTPLSPSLVSLNTREGFVTSLAGLSLKNVTLSLFEEGKKKPLYTELGELLFTHKGISGPLTLSASAHISDCDNKKYYCTIDLKPALTHEQLDKRILRDFSEFSNKEFRNSLSKLLPASLIPVVVSLSGIQPEVRVNQIDKTSREKLVGLIKCLTLNIRNKGAAEEAVITRGGVSVKEINPATMESKLIKGLYFAGEIIDVDAYTGGFNLQIAFSTGALAGKSASEE